MERRESSALRPDLSVNSFPEGSLIPDYREPETPVSNGKKYHTSMKSLIPIRFSSGSICLSYASTDDDASFNLSVIMSHILFILFHIHELIDCCDCQGREKVTPTEPILLSWPHDRIDCISKAFIIINHERTLFALSYQIFVL